MSKSTLEKYHLDYLRLVKQWKFGNLRYLETHKIYEILMAIDIDMILWDDLPPDFDTKFKVPHKIDYGIDLVSLYYDKGCQVKLYHENSRITWSNISKYYTYSKGILNIDQITKPEVTPINEGELRELVELWCKKQFNPELLQEYGHIRDWNVGNITNMSEIFSDYDEDYEEDELRPLKITNKFNDNINNWDVGNVTNMEDMFRDVKRFNQPLDNWKVDNVTNMKCMFRNASKFNQPLDKWDVGNVTDMSEMFGSASTYEPKFWGAKSFNQPLNNWDVGNVNNMLYMFDSASKFNQPLDNWNVNNVKYMNNMFDQAERFNPNMHLGIILALIIKINFIFIFIFICKITVDINFIYIG